MVHCGPLPVTSDEPCLKGVVFDVMRYCVHDGPGIRTTVFLKGCPLRCSWCHNPEGQLGGIELSLREGRCVRCGACLRVCPHGAVVEGGSGYVLAREKCRRCGACVEACHAQVREQVGKEMTAEEVMDEVLRDVAFYDQSGGGATFSGGEPLVQALFLEALLKACKARGIHTAIETSGFSSWETLEGIAASTDLFLYDVKLMDDEEHRRLTGVSNAPILDNLSRLSLAGHAVVARMPVLPGINDGEPNLRTASEFLRARTNVREVHLLPFHRIGKDKASRLGRRAVMPDLPVPADDVLWAVAAFFEREGLRVTIGG